MVGAFKTCGLCLVLVILFWGLLVAGLFVYLVERRSTKPIKGEFSEIEE